MFESEPPEVHLEDWEAWMLRGQVERGARIGRSHEADAAEADMRAAAARGEDPFAGYVPSEIGEP